MHKHIKMYGEDFELVLDPFVEGDYTTVHAISRNDPKVRELRLPVSILIDLPDPFRKRAKFAGQRLYGFVRTARDALVSHCSRVINIEQTAEFPFNYGPASGLPSAHHQIRKTEERQNTRFDRGRHVLLHLVACRRVSWLGQWQDDPERRIRDNG
jgi:hypothetical protein